MTYFGFRLLLKTAIFVMAAFTASSSLADRPDDPFMKQILKAKAKKAECERQKKLHKPPVKLRC